MSPRKFGVISCEDLEKWGGHESGRALVDIFRAGDHEEWEYFKGPLSELPDVNRLDEYQAFILSGSHYSVNDSHKWIQELERFLKDVFEYQKNHKTLYPKVVGICFGHQIMAKAIGAKVTKNLHGKFVFGLDRINVSDELKAMSCYQGVFPEMDDSFVLFESHSDEVRQIPPVMVKCVGSSDVCENEVLFYGDDVSSGLVSGLSFQGHMEITNEQCLMNILPAIKQAGLFTEQDEVVLNEKIKMLTNQREEIIKVIQNFIQ